MYKEKILPENRDPYNFKTDESASLQLRAYNPVCGDKFQLFINVNDAKVEESSFDGFGCAISKASTSILMKKIEGQSLESIMELCKRLCDSLTGREDHDFEDKELKILNELKNFDGRTDCVKLSWESLYNYLKDQ